jgi:hypothetical protein
MTMVSSLHPSELWARLYSGACRGMNFHCCLGCGGYSTKLRVTCGVNGMSIDKYSSMNFPYRLLGSGINHSPSSVWKNTYHLDPVVF